jgi:signal transduction histidine kinase
MLDRTTESKVTKWRQNEHAECPFPMKPSQTHPFWRSAALCFLSSVALASVTFVCFRLHDLPAAAALLYMVIIVLVSLQGRLIPAIFASFVAVFCLDYFFIVKPVFRVALTETLDVVALVAYLTTALVVTGLLSRVRKSFQQLLRSEARLAESEQRRAAQLAKANEALRACLDRLAQVPELDDFLGQVMAAITRQLGAFFSTLRMLNEEQNRLTLELVFQEDRVLSPIEAGFPEAWRSVSPDEQHLAAYQAQPTTVTRLLDPQSPTPEGLRDYLLGLGIKTGLIIPLASGRQMHGLVALYFKAERDFDQEELEIARALVTQAALAIHLTRLAKTARQSAVLEERNRLAGEIHDSLAQSFAGISMQLFAAQEVIESIDDNGLGYIERANDLARFGLAEARRSALSLRSDIIEESGLVEALQMLVERSSIPGRLRCNFRSNGVRKESLPLHIQQDFLRIAQEAISNALRHAKPTVISVNLRLDSPNLILEIRDNGSGIDNTRLENGEGLGLGNMRDRAKTLGAELDIRTADGRGTSIIVRLPVDPFLGH